MTASKSRECRVGIRVDTWDVERLAQVLGGDELVTGLAVELTDGSTCRIENATELESIENARGRRIRAIVVESTPPAFLFNEEGTSRLALVTIREGPGDTIRYYVTGSVRAVNDLSRELDDWVASLQPRYGSIAVMDRSRLLGWSAAVVAAVALMAHALYLGVGGGTEFATGMTPARLPWLTTAAGLLTVAALAVVLNVGRDRLMPAAQFRIGKGVETSARLDRRRAWLLRAGVLAAAVAMGGSVLGVFLT
jgi:hypothetical protein